MGVLVGTRNEGASQGKTPIHFKYIFYPYPFSPSLHARASFSNCSELGVPLQLDSLRVCPVPKKQLKKYSLPLRSEKRVLDSLSAPPDSIIS